MYFFQDEIIDHKMDIFLLQLWIHIFFLHHRNYDLKF